MGGSNDNLGLIDYYWNGCTFWYSSSDNKFYVYESLDSLYNFCIQMSGDVWVAEAYDYGGSSPVGLLNWLSDFRGRSLIELLSLVVIVFNDNIDALVFTDCSCPASHDIIMRAALLRENLPLWVKNFEHFEPNIPSDD